MPLTKDLSRLLVAGQQVFSRYRLQRVLERGGMVWMAYDEQLDREVTLKFVAGEWLRDGVVRDELRQETKCSLKLAHPNLVRTYDYMDGVEVAAVATEYVEGATLSQLRIERPSATFDAEELVQVVRDCCQVLDYAHQQVGMVHGDVRPSNILVTCQGVAKISDFGISRALQKAGAETPGGSLGFKSPQQLRGEPAAATDDVYGFGATLYELLTGRPPFHTGDLHTQIQEVTAEPVDKRRLKHGVEGRPVPAVWVKTIAACLAKDPAQRPATMREVAERLGLGNRTSARYVAETAKATEARREPSPPAPPIGNIRRTALIVAGVVMAILGVVAGVMAVLVPAQRANEQAVKRTTKPVSPAARVVDVSTGTLVVKSNPTGAAVLMGKEKKGTTPFTITGVSPGGHEVHVMMEGYEPVSSTVAIRGGETTDLGIVTLQRIAGSLLVESDPPGCTFVLLPMNSETEIRRGKTPDKIVGLPTGQYRVRMERPGWPTSEIETDVSDVGAQTVSRRFGQGTIEVTTDPPGAELRLAEKVIGLTPRQVTLPSGKHGPFTLQLKGFQAVQFDAHVTPGEVTKIPVIKMGGEPPSLAVVSTPPGVKFKLYAEAALSQPIVEGITPDLFTDIPAGNYRVVFHSPPWPEVARSVSVAAHGVTELEQVFTAGRITVNSEPAGATILLGGKEVGKTPFERELPAGKYEVAANYKGRLARTRSVNLADEDSETIRFDFTTSGSTSSTASKVKSRRKPAPKEPYMKKVGRSISNFFTMDPKRR